MGGNKVFVKLMSRKNIHLKKFVELLAIPLIDRAILLSFCFVFNKHLSSSYDVPDSVIRGGKVIKNK